MLYVVCSQRQWLDILEDTKKKKAAKEKQKKEAALAKRESEIQAPVDIIITEPCKKSLIVHSFIVCFYLSGFLCLTTLSTYFY